MDFLCNYSSDFFGKYVLEFAYHKEGHSSYNVCHLIGYFGFEKSFNEVCECL